MAIVINGSGTLSGLAVGGLPDGTVDSGTLATDSVVTGKIADGTIANADIADLAASKLTGALPAISGASLTGVGKVLQVVQGTTSSAVASSTVTKVDTGLTATITPSATTSKILCMVMHTGCYKVNSTSLEIKLQRNGTDISDISRLAFYTGDSFSIRDTISGNYLDSPASTSAVVYKTQFASEANVASVQVQVNSSNSTIVLLEIGA